MLRWARANGCTWHKDTCAYAAEGGHLEVLQWLRENGCPWDTETCLMAAEGGHIEVLQWARANGCPWDEKGLLIIAAGKGRETMVRALIDFGADINKATNDGVTPLCIAVQEGH